MAFRSLANDLVSGDSNGFMDIFLRDRQASTTERVSVSSAGVEANCGSGSAGVLGISADGRFVTFDSCASNLVSGDTNATDDVFVHDRLGVSPTATPTPSVQPTPSSTFTVNSTGDGSDTNAGDGICLTAVGDCTLRAAIQESNAHTGQDTVNFVIASGQLAPTIEPASPLPAMTDSVTVDGTTQPQYNGSPLIEMKGANAGSGAGGLDITAGSSIVRALAITGFDGVGITLESNGGNRLEKSRI